MNRIVLHTRVGMDGVLHPSVPMGKAAAGREVEVIIEAPVPKDRANSEREEWQQFMSETAGAWQGDLDRPERGEYEQRDELP